MARMNSRNLAEYDGNVSAILRNLSAGAVIVTTAEAPVALNTLTAPYWDANLETNGVFTVAVDISAISRVNSNESYVLNVEVSPTAGFATVIQIARLRIEAANAFQGFPGFYPIHIASGLIELIAPTAQFIRIRAAIGGTAPSITYGANITFMAN